MAKEDLEKMKKQKKMLIEGASRTKRVLKKLKLEKIILQGKQAFIERELKEKIKQVNTLQLHYDELEKQATVECGGP